MRKLLALSIVVAAFGGGAATNTAHAEAFSNQRMQTLQAQMDALKMKADEARSEVETGYSWETITRGNGYVIQAMGEAVRIDNARARLKTLNAKLASKWKQYVEERTRYRAWLFGDISAWLCIHHYEAAWNDTGDPYWGGLQMDTAFMSHYGSDLVKTKGAASNWTPMEQIMVAQRAYRSGRGYYPWPNTARYCGLI